MPRYKNPALTNPAQIKRLQTKLKNLGLYSGKIDGIYGPLTEKSHIDYNNHASFANIGSTFSSPIGTSFRKVSQYLGLPLNARQFIADQLGSESTLDETDLTKEEFNALQNIVRKNLTAGKKTISYEDYATGSDIGGTKMNTSTFFNKLADPYWNLKTTLGQASINVNNGDTTVTDQYNFNDQGIVTPIEALQRFVDRPDPYSLMRSLGTIRGSGVGRGSKINIKTNEPKPTKVTWTPPRHVWGSGGRIDIVKESTPRLYQEGGESRYVQPKNILNPKAPKQYPVYKQPRDPNAFYRNASPGSINEDYTIESFLLPSPALKGVGQLYKGTKAGFKRLAKEGLEDEAKLASEYAAKVQSRANIAAKRDGRLLNKQRVLGQADFEDLTNDARHFYSEHGIELPPAEFDAIKHLNPHVNKAAARQALKAADAGDDVFGGLHGKATLRDARRAGLSDDEINQMRAGRLKPYTNPARPIVGFYGSNRHGGKVSYGDGGMFNPGQVPQGYFLNPGAYDYRTKPKVYQPPIPTKEERLGNVGRNAAKGTVDQDYTLESIFLPMPPVGKALGKIAKIGKGKKALPTSTPFKSEIDWAKWNPETPKHKVLMDEYNAIEESTKKAGTWMKNPDGSPFQGTSEQFIQQQSSHFKKAFGNSKLVNPDGSPIFLYHGSAKKFDTFDPSKFQLGDAGYSGTGIYTTPSKVTADSYTISSAKFHTGDIEPTVYQLYGQGNRPIKSSDLIKENQGRDLFNFYRNKNWKGELSPYESLKEYDVAIADQLPNVQNIRPMHDAREIVFPTNTQLKSAVGNVGFFDMSDPNIYKSLVPAAIGTAALGITQQKKEGGRVSYRTGSRLIPNPGFDTGVQVSDATRTRIPKNAQAALASEEYNKDLTGRSGLSEEGFRAKYNKSRARARNMPSSFDVISNQLWEGAKEPFKFIGADPDLIRTNPAEGIPQALAGTLMLELPVGEMYQASKQGISRLKKALGTESGLLSNTYKVNPWAERLNNANKSYRVAGMDALEDFQNTGVLRSQRALPENPTFLDKVKARPTSFPSFQKGYADLNYLPDEGGVIFETGLPTFKRGEINPVTGLPIKGRHYAHRVIDPETGKIMTEIPGSNINVYGSKPHWLKGYKQIDVPQPSFKSEIDWSKWNKEIPENKSLMEEYYTIEQTSKANGTWMKNPDGSAFQGTPEQFIQQNSQNFKKAFPNGALTTFRGGSSNNVMRGNLASDNPNIGSIFTGNKTSIHRYGDRNRIITPEENSIDNGEPGMMELLYNKKNNVLEFDAKNSNWDNIKKELLPDNHKTIKAITQTSRENPLITTTDDIAIHLQDKDIDYATINNIIDGTPFSRETIFNHKPGNYLKSRWYNNGMFDMTNPNIYKAVVPTIMGATALKTRQQKKEGGEIEPTRQESRVKEYGFGGKLFKSIGDGLQNSGAFLADNALSIAGATEAANNLYTDSRFGKAAQNVSKITNQINKVAGTIGATALGGPAAGMAMGQVQNMTGNINRKPNQEYNDWDVAGQYAGSLSSMAGMFYNPAGATSSVNPKAKYGGPIRRKIAKQGGTIRPTQGGMFINEGFGIEHALGNLHEDGGIVYNDRTEVENNEKILDGNYVLTDQPYSEPYMKESISRRFDKNSKAISDRNNPDITESAMSFLKDEAIAKNEEYLESLESMTNRYAKGGWIQKATDSIERRGTEGKCTPITKPGCTGRARALALTFKKMAKNRHQDGGSIRNLGTQEGRVVTNRFVDGGLTETDLLNQEEARKMAALKQSILNQNSLPTSQRQYYIDPIQEAYDPTWMGDVYNTARNHDIAVQRANDISNDPNYAGYGQGSKGIPYRYPSPKPQTQKQFPWEDTLYGVASLAPAIYNMGAGLFGKTQQYNPENYITRGRLSYKPISGEEVKRQINNQRAATDYQLRDAGITSRRSRLSNSYNAMQTMAQAQEIIDNINTQGQLETDKYNIGLDQDNNRIRLTVADINDRNRAARQNMLAQGFSDISEFAQGTRRDKIMKSMLTKMYGRRGGRIAW